MNTQEINNTLFSKKEFNLKTNMRGFIILASIITILVLIYFIGNFNKFTIISLNGSTDSFEVNDGLIIQSPGINRIRIDNIKFKEKNYNLRSIKIDLLLRNNKNEIIDKYSSTTNIDFNVDTSIEEFLGNYRLNIPGKKSKNYRIKSNKLYLNIHIIDEFNNIIDEEVLLNKSKISSNHLFYF